MGNVIYLIITLTLQWAGNQKKGELNAKKSHSGNRGSR